MQVKDLDHKLFIAAGMIDKVITILEQINNEDYTLLKNKFSLLIKEIVNLITKASVKGANSGSRS